MKYLAVLMLICPLMSFAQYFSFEEEMRQEMDIQLPPGVPESMKAQMGMQPPTTTKMNFYLTNDVLATHYNRRITIMDVKKGTITNIELDKKTYSQETFKEFYARVNKMIDKQKAKQLEMSGKVERKATKTTKTIAGYKCRIYKEKSKMAMAGHSSDIIGESCYALKPPGQLTQFYKKAAAMAQKHMSKKHFQWLSQMGQSYAGIGAFANSESDSFTFNLKHTGTVALGAGGSSGAGMKQKITKKVLNTSKKKFSLAKVSVPKGFKKVAPEAFF